MATRAQLPDTFYVNGTLVTLPLAADETIARWMERLAFVIRYLENPANDGSSDYFRAAQEASRLHLQQLVHGVRYA
jgi:hypothetical protein